MSFLRGNRGLLDRLGGDDAPAPTFVQPDANTERLMGQGADEALRSPDQWAQDATAGIDQIRDRAMPTGDQVAQQQQGLAMSPTGLEGALAARYSRLAGQDIDAIKRKADVQARMKRADRLQESSVAYQGKQQAMAENYAQLMEANIANQRARAAVLQSVLGAGGMMAGHAMANRQAPAPQTAQPRTMGGMPRPRNDIA